MAFCKLKGDDRLYTMIANRCHDNDKRNLYSFSDTIKWEKAQIQNICWIGDLLSPNPIFFFIIFNSKIILKIRFWNVDIYTFLNVN